ncbi:MAG: enoyl-CoA hydratase/isomerase family protein [Haloferacaceae archaeon]
MSEQYTRIHVEKDDQVATISLAPHSRDEEELEEEYDGPEHNSHWELANALDDIRSDNDVRVVVITGGGDSFKHPPAEMYRSETGKENRNDPRRIWCTFVGHIRAHQTIAEMEKVVVGKVNGDAVGFGQSLALACDLIVAVEDARFIDHHMAMGEIEDIGPEYGIVTGDGGSSLLPLYMSPPKAKEYLMLGKPYTGADLADMDLINYAVPPEELDEKVDELVEALLKRSAYALAWTKRTANRRVVDHLSKTLDASSAYEMVNFLQAEWLDWNDPRSFTWRGDEGVEEIPFDY